ncbi:MAG: glutathione S-transferase [Endozoicomonas sp. (ex Botrylloides leachii)]|nr:glutathione S-transferase [Endozoicomonas sp. (ex Botrylloides leachii)]
MGASKIPVFYSFRRCPYAIRARLAISYSGMTVALREVVLRDKPKELITASSKATVPVLLLEDGSVIDESLDIMLWALQQHDPNHWGAFDSGSGESLIAENDTSFKYWLDRYKYADRHPEFSRLYYRQQCQHLLEKLESVLAKTPFLQGKHFGITDAAILPFIRQFAHVDKTWFAQSGYHNIKRWLYDFMQSALFLSVMNKYPQWQLGDKPIYFPQNAC